MDEQKQGAKAKPQLICVDDDPMILFQYKRIFEAEGFEVHTGTSGHDLGCLLHDVKPVAAVILDLSMPSLDGITALKRLKHSAPWVIGKIIVVSGIVDSAVKGELEALGVSYLLKPVKFAQLVQMVGGQRSA